MIPYHKRYKKNDFEWLGHVDKITMINIITGDAITLSSFLKPILNQFSYMTHQIEA